MQEFVWLNEDLVPLDHAKVSVNDRGFQYGDGMFETLRAEAGAILFLREHLARLEASAKIFRLPFPADFPWEERLERLLEANGLEQKTARMKILLSRGPATGVGLPVTDRPTLVIWAQPYEPPTPEEYAAGWPVATFPGRRTTFIARHKSLNYLFYLTARQFALDWEAKEALILEADGQVSEGSAASLVYLQGEQYFTPEAASALPGVTVAVLARGLARHSLNLEAALTYPEQLAGADGVWLANALLGLMPVSAIDGRGIALSEQSGFLQDILWAEAWRGRGSRRFF